LGNSKKEKEKGGKYDASRGIGEKEGEGEKSSISKGREKRRKNLTAWKGVPFEKKRISLKQDRRYKGGVWKKTKEWESVMPRSRRKCRLPITLNGAKDR